MRCSSQRASILGSFCGRLAFISNSVCGKLMVAFSSSGTPVSCHCSRLEWRLKLIIGLGEFLRPFAHKRRLIGSTDQGWVNRGWYLDAHICLPETHVQQLTIVLIPSGMAVC